MNVNRQKLNENIRLIGSELIDHFEKDRLIIQGVNGPYNDKETIVRNLCHLIVITSIEIRIYNKIKLKKQLELMGKLLLDCQGKDGLYVLRKKKSKDQCNGVIGHAWVIEAFIYLFKIFKDESYLNEAISLYKMHKFNYKLGLWNRPNKLTNSDIDYIDYTFNHQLWFAAISSELYSHSKKDFINNDLERFFQVLQKNFNINSKGLICHSILNKRTKYNTLKANIKRLLNIINAKIGKPSYEYKENGYHIFNLAAFGRLYKVYPDKDFWLESKFIKAMEYTNSNTLLSKLADSTDIDLDLSLKSEIKNEDEKKYNIYGFPYNVPGFEMIYIEQIFGNKINTEIVDKYLQKQFELTYDAEKRKLGKSCFDKVTINYRIYEYYKAVEERDSK